MPEARIPSQYHILVGRYTSELNGHIYDRIYNIEKGHNR